MLLLGCGLSVQLPEEIGHGRLVRIRRYNMLREESNGVPFAPAIVVRPGARNQDPDVAQATRFVEQ
jgi:hypothetical protein